MSEKWTCAACGAQDNSGMFCLTCGAPRNGFTGMMMPVTDEIPQDRGPLVKFVWSTSSSGMMYMSRETYDTAVIWNEDGTVTMTDRSWKEAESRTEKEYSVDPSDAEKLRAALDQEEILSWTSLKYDFNDPTRPTDVSHSANWTLEFVPAEGSRPVPHCSIDLNAVTQQKKTDRISDVREILASLEKEDRIIRDETEQLFMPNGMTKQEYFVSMMTTGGPKAPASPAPPAPVGNSDEMTAGPGQWKCRYCGNVNEGKFCSECGAARSDAEITD